MRVELWRDHQGVLHLLDDRRAADHLIGMERLGFVHLDLRDERGVQIPEEGTSGI